MRSFVIFSLIATLLTPALAETYFKDVPQGHWAEDSVYDLVKMGVTGGFPDGTYRGKKDMNRYEIAAFLSKFDKSFRLQRGINEKLTEEMKSEVALLKYKQDKAQQETNVAGALEGRGRVSTTYPRGGKIDYRLKASLTRNVDQNSSLKITLDTMDAGFNSSVTREIATKLLDIEGRCKAGPLNLKMNIGPGTVPHNESNGLFPSENNTIFIRPKSAIEISSVIERLNYSAAYVTRQVKTSGLIGLNELTGKAGYDFGALSAYLRPRYLYVVDGKRDVLLDGGFDLNPGGKFETNVLVSFGKFSEGDKGAYIKLVEKLNDPWAKGTNIMLRFDRVGAGYRVDDLDEYEFVYLNNFDRLILDGTMDLGVSLNQKFTDKFAFEWKSDYVTADDGGYGEAYPGTYFLWQLGFTYDLFQQVKSRLFYKNYNVPSGIAQFADVVPKMSELWGAGVECSF